MGRVSHTKKWCGAMKMSRLEEKIFRAWYYFRTGYSTYITFVLGIISFTTTTYYLAINNIPFLSKIFPDVFIYIAFLLVFLPPIAVVIGWIHMKKSLAYPSQMSVGVESNPYTYKLQPGISTELSWPMWGLIWSIVEDTLDGSRNLTTEQRTSIQELRKKIRILLDGGSIGLTEDLRLKHLESRTEGRRDEER